MAYIVTSEFGTVDEPTTTLTIPLPSHDENDLVLIILGEDSTTLSGWSTDWNQELFINSTEDLRIFSHIGKATQLTEFTATISGTNDEFAWWILVIKGAPSTSPIAVVSGSTPDADGDNLVEIPSIDTTGNDGCLIITGYVSNSHPNGFPQTGLFTIWAIQMLNYLGVSLAYTHQQNGGATTNYRFHSAYTASSDTFCSFALAIKTTEAKRPCCDDTTKPAEMIFANGRAGGGGEFGVTENGVDMTTLIPTIGGDTNNYLNSSSDEGILFDGIQSARIGYITSSAYIGDKFTCGYEFKTTQNLSGAVLSMSSLSTYRNGDFTYDEYHNFFGLSNGTNAYIWKLTGSDTVPNPRIIVPVVIELDGNIDETSDRVGTSSPVSSATHFIQGSSPTDTYNAVYLAPLYKLQTMKIIGGSTTYPASFNTCVELAKTGLLNSVQNQFDQTLGQFYATQSVSIGNGSDALVWDSTGQSIEFPSILDLSDKRVQSKVSSGTFTLTIDSSCILSSNTFNMGDYHNWYYKSGTVTGSGLVLNANIQLDGPALTGWMFSACKEITYTSLTTLNGGNTFDSCVDSQVIIVTSKTDFEKLQNCKFTSNSALSVKITGDQSGSRSGAGMTVSGGWGSYDIEYTWTTDFSIQFDVWSGWSQVRTNNSSTWTLTVATPTTDVTINSNIAASDIKLFDGGTTQTVTDSTTWTSLSYTYSGTKTWFYTVQKAWYVPQRWSITGTDEDLVVNVTLKVDPVYNSWHWLVWTTNYEYNATTRVLTIVQAQEWRNIYSSLIEEFISRSTLYNRPFPLSAIWPDRIDFTSDGTTAATIDSWDIQYWRGAGMEWEDATTWNKTHKFCSLKWVGTNPSWTTWYYQPVDWSNTTALSLVNNNVDQVVQFYSDPNWDGSTADWYDRSWHLVLKLFKNWYYQARSDILQSFGISALEAFEYTVSLEITSTGLTVWNPAISISITDHTASPITVWGKDFDYEIVDWWINSATDIQRQINYDITNDPTATIYTSYTAFNLPDKEVFSSSFFSWYSKFDL